MIYSVGEDPWIHTRMCPMPTLTTFLRNRASKAKLDVSFAHLFPYGYLGFQSIDGIAHGFEGRGPVGRGHSDDDTGFGHGNQASTERREVTVFCESGS